MAASQCQFIDLTFSDSEDETPAQTTTPLTRNDDVILLDNTEAQRIQSLFQNPSPNQRNQAHPSRPQYNLVARPTLQTDDSKENFIVRQPAPPYISTSSSPASALQPPDGVPLPRFHQPPQQTAKRPQQISKLPSRPHTNTSDGGIRSPDRKRMRLYETAPTSSTRHGITPTASRAPLQNSVAFHETPSSDSYNTQANGTSNQHTGSHVVSVKSKRTAWRKPFDSHPSSLPTASGTKAADNCFLCSMAGADTLHGIAAEVSSLMKGIPAGSNICEVHDNLMQLTQTGVRTHAIAQSVAETQDIFSMLMASEDFPDLVKKVVRSLAPSTPKEVADEVAAHVCKTFIHSIGSPTDRETQMLDSLKTLLKNPDAHNLQCRHAIWLKGALYYALEIFGVLVPRSGAVADSIRPNVVHNVRPPLGGADAMDADTPIISKPTQVATRRRKRKRDTEVDKQKPNADVDALRLKGGVLHTSPYLSSQSLSGLGDTTPTFRPAKVMLSVESLVIHVPFTEVEIEETRLAVNEWYSTGNSEEKSQIRRDVRPELLRQIGEFVRPFMASVEGSSTIRKRQVEDYIGFLRDVGPLVKFMRGEYSSAAQSKPKSIVSRQIGSSLVRHDGGAADFQTLLRERETTDRFAGQAFHDLESTVSNKLDDSFLREIEFTNASGDVGCLAWLSDDHFICGASTLGDPTSQQYNDPGNLNIGTLSTRQLRWVDGHKIRRPVVDEGVNSTETMKRNMDAYIYLTVAATAYDKIRGLCFTGSFDNTVGVWTIEQQFKDAKTATLNPMATWSHDGHVNFILTSPHHNKVATGADARDGAIRVYDLEDGDIESPDYSSYQHPVANGYPNRHPGSSWAYFPCTMQWGRTKEASRYLLAGYSPRSARLYGEFPESKKDSGQLCVWNTDIGEEVTINGPTTQNVFEVAWHPNEAWFVAATSAASGADKGFRTQIRLFVYKEPIGAAPYFHAYKVYDCVALDINEITLKPTSRDHFYLTVSCTDRRTYIYDTAQGEKATNILSHGEPIDELDPGIPFEEIDQGVKFVAWGRTLDRLYTGSSDGVLKCWNVRAPVSHEHVYDVAEFPAGISSGSFSPDHSRLLVGDASARVHVLKNVDLDYEEKFPRQIVRIMPQAAQAELSTHLVKGGAKIAWEYIKGGQLIAHPDKWIGVYQGPNYAETGKFCRSRWPDDYRKPLSGEALKQRRKGWEFELPGEVQEKLAFNRMRNPQALGSLHTPDKADESNSNVSGLSRSLGLELPLTESKTRDGIELACRPYDAEPAARKTPAKDHQWQTSMSQPFLPGHHLSKFPFPSFIGLLCILCHDLNRITSRKIAFQE